MRVDRVEVAVPMKNKPAFGGSAVVGRHKTKG
ncbi:hypothetical protein BSNT_10075 [Bacillus subtilis subsp. natto BEST195]|nr:hypothetical protein BSNT_10075 [Bacillus subtilis subsp. natto BEST195]